ncbi:MAG: hypothetical protein WAX69_13985 [Victivallales bacterium]
MCQRKWVPTGMNFPDTASSSLNDKAIANDTSASASTHRYRYLFNQQCIITGRRIMITCVEYDTAIKQL